MLPVRLSLALSLRCLHLVPFAAVETPAGFCKPHHTYGLGILKELAAA